MTNIEMSKMTEEEFYNDVIAAVGSKRKKAINTSSYTLEQQLNIFCKTEQDQRSRKLLAEEICALI
jgi:hypothetical protein